MNPNEQHTDVNELIKRRFEELDELKGKGFECYPYEYNVTAYSDDIKSDYDNFESKTVAIAGRIMAIRRMGKASFAHIQDKQGIYTD